MTSSHYNAVINCKQSGNLFGQAPDLVRLYERLLACAQNHRKMNHSVKRFTITYVSENIRLDERDGLSLI